MWKLWRKIGLLTTTKSLDSTTNHSKDQLCQYIYICSLIHYIYIVFPWQQIALLDPTMALLPSTLIYHGPTSHFTMAADSSAIWERLYPLEPLKMNIQSSHSHALLCILCKQQKSLAPFSSWDLSDLWDNIHWLKQWTRLRSHWMKSDLKLKIHSIRL